jgi:hypothetical protein
MNVNDSAYRAGSVAVRGAAYMAPQQILGLLPERWVGIGRGRSTGAGSGRAPVESVLENDGSYDPVALPLEIFFLGRDFQKLTFE